MMTKIIFALVALLVVVVVAVAASVSHAHAHAAHGLFHPDIERALDLLNAKRDAEAPPPFKQTRDFTDPVDRVMRALAAEVPEDEIAATLAKYGRERADVVKILRSYKPLTSAPQQIHLSFGSENSVMTVMWTTSTASTHSMVKFRTVRGGGGQTTWTNRTGDAYTYHPISVIPWHGMIHKAAMVGLKGGDVVEYQVGDQVLGEFSDAVTFTVPNRAADEVSIALGGDMGTVQLVGYKVAKQMLGDFHGGRKFDAFWLLGDIAYSTLDPPKLNIEFFWDMFLQQEQSFSSSVPIAVTYGNHDFSGGDSGAFIHRFAMPNASGGVGNFYWAYEHGPITFVSACSEVGLLPAICNYAPGSAQYKWIEKTLANVNRTRTPWVILVHHRPQYSSDTALDSGRLRVDLEPLTLKYKVDAVFAGHLHGAEAVSPVNNMKADLSGVTEVAKNEWLMQSPKSPVHLTAGTLGALIREKYVEPQPKWSLFRSGSFWAPPYGYVALTANRTTLSYEFLAQKSNSTLFKVTIKK